LPRKTFIACHSFTLIFSANWFQELSAMEERKRRGTDGDPDVIVLRSAYAQRKAKRIKMDPPKEIETPSEPGCSWADLPVELGAIILSYAAQDWVTEVVLPFVCHLWKERKPF